MTAHAAAAPTVASPIPAVTAGGDARVTGGAVACPEGARRGDGRVTPPGVPSGAGGRGVAHPAGSPAERPHAGLAHPPWGSGGVPRGTAHPREQAAPAVPPAPRRVSVVGVTGSGKTTFAAALAATLGCAHVELDALHWEPNWVMAELPVFRDRVAAALAGERWVADGNYAKVRDLVWDRADTVVWLDYPFPLTFGRLLRRTVARLRTGELLWGTNRERWRDHFLSRESLLLWAIQTYPKYRRTYPTLLADERYRHLALVRLRSPRQAERWLAAVAATTPAGPLAPARVGH
jgi:adenylate kinase family enzyme